MFIVFEGMDGAGKSTIAKGVANYSKEKIVMYMGNPGGSALGHELRKLIKNNMPRRKVVDFLMLCANRMDIAYDVTDFLKCNKDGWAIVDRWDISAHVYQGMSMETGLMKDKIYWNLFPMQEEMEDLVRPDVLVYLDVDEALCHERLSGRVTEINEEDRYEQGKDESFSDWYKKMVNAYTPIVASMTTGGLNGWKKATDFWHHDHDEILVYKGNAHVASNTIPYKYIIRVPVAKGINDDKDRLVADLFKIITDIEKNEGKNVNLQHIEVEYTESQKRHMEQLVTMFSNINKALKEEKGKANEASTEVETHSEENS